MPIERFFINIERYGNTSTASIPLAVSEAVEARRLQPNDCIVLVAFGAGLTWGALQLDWAVEPTPVSHIQELIREGWYILARMRSLLLRLFRLIEALIWDRPARRRQEKTAQHPTDHDGAE